MDKAILLEMGRCYCVVGKSHKKSPECFRCVESFKPPSATQRHTLSKCIQNPKDLNYISTVSLSCFPKKQLVAQTINNLPAIQETWVQSLGQEDTLEEEMTAYSSVLAWRIPWTEEPPGI